MVNNKEERYQSSLLRHNAFSINKFQELQSYHQSRIFQCFWLFITLDAITNHHRSGDVTRLWKTLLIFHWNPPYGPLGIRKSCAKKKVRKCSLFGIMWFFLKVTLQQEYFLFKKPFLDYDSQLRFSKENLKHKPSLKPKKSLSLSIVETDFAPSKIQNKPTSSILFYHFFKILIINSKILCLRSVILMNTSSNSIHFCGYSIH